MNHNYDDEVIQCHTHDNQRSRKRDQEILKYIFPYRKIKPNKLRSKVEPKGLKRFGWYNSLELKYFLKLILNYI